MAAGSATSNRPRVATSVTRHRSAAASVLNPISHPPTVPRTLPNTADAQIASTSVNARPPRRAARQPGPELPRGEFLLEPPPDLAESVGGGIGQYLLYLPMIGGAGA